MAWVLRKKDSSDEVKLLANREYVVGRKEVDIILNNDQSISRRHAIFSISHPDCNISKASSLPVVKLKDVSKYGTSVNEEKIDKDGVIINSGDRILFGILENNWSIQYKPFICATSFLQKPERTLVRQYLTKIGGHMVSEWIPQCNLLVMSQLNMSIKVINALASLCHIVTVKFLKDLVDAVEKGTDEPSHKRYIPLLAEPLQQEDANSFTPNRLRSSVFFGFKFFCISSKQMKKLQFAIEMGGGEALLVESHKGSFPSILVDDSVCVLQPSNEELNVEFTKTLTNHLNRHSLRYISEAEIGMAILHCSTERFCNPRGSGEKEYLLQSLSSQSLSSQFINPSSHSEQVKFSEPVKMESCEMDYGSSTSDQPATLENDPFLQDTQEYSANQERRKQSKNAKLANYENSPEQKFMDSHPAPSRSSPDMFLDVSPTPPTKVHKNDSRFSSCRSDAKRNSSAISDEQGVRNMNCHSENENHILPSCSKHNHTTSPSIAEDILSKEKQPDGVRESYVSVTLSTPVGFLSSRNLLATKTGDDSSKDLETSHIVIKFKSLIRKRKAEEPVQATTNGSTKKNFKKFKKVFPKSGSVSGSVVLFRPSNGLTVSVREANSNQENGEPMNLSPSYSQSQSDGLFNWPTQLRN